MTARVDVLLVEGPLAKNLCAPKSGCGARLEFEGIVRPQEGEREIAALNYEAYEPMTTRELYKLAERYAVDYSLLAVVVEHSIGCVPTGEVSFRLTISSKHRKEGLLAADEFIDAMKRDVPLWKTPVWT